MFIEKLLTFFCKENETDNKKYPSEFALEAELERKAGNCEVALAAINKALKSEKDNDMFYITRALIYKAQNDFKSALADIEKALRLNPNVEKTKTIQKEILEEFK